MNLIAQIVPGLRDARIAISSGVLWVLVAWILSLSVPGHIWQAQVLKTAVSQLSNVPVELIVPVGLLVAYVLGIVLDMVRKIAFRIAFVALLVMAALVFYESLSTLRQMVEFAALLGASLMIWFAVEIWSRRRHKPTEGYLKTLDDAFEHIVIQIGRLAGSFLDRVLRILAADRRKIMDEVRQRQIDILLSQQPAMLRSALDSLTPDAVAVAAQAAGLTVDDIRRLTPLETQAELVSIHGLAS